MNHKKARTDAEKRSGDDALMSFLQVFFVKNQSFPTMSEIRDSFSYSSATTAVTSMQRLVDRGLLEKVDLRKKARFRFVNYRVELVKK